MEKWEFTFRGKRQKPETLTKLYPHVILYDFEAFGGKSQRKEQKMRAVFMEHSLIDILKDAVSIPGVTMHDLLWGALESVAELWSPCKEE